jgi:DNA-binding response OmpR family regulator
LTESVDVIAVGDGSAAVQAVREHLADLVLTDLVLPHVDGIGILATLRSDPTLSTLPVILMVPHGGHTRPGSELGLEADDILVKPWTDADVIARVQTLLDLDHVRRTWATVQEHAAREMARTGEERSVALDVPVLARVARCVLRPERIDVTATARRILAHLCDADPARVVDVHVADGLTAIGDPELVTIALGHLLGNAWKFTGKRARAEICVESDRDGVFLVRDNGAGFDMAEVERLFRPFERLHPVEAFDGEGLGLAVVRCIIERHGGEAWAYGEVDRGATIWFSLGPGSDAVDPDHL